MRDQWYGDNRDLIKWGVLLELARRGDLRHILHVLYYRPSKWAQLEIDGDQCELPQTVVRHFRRAAAIVALETSAKVEVIEEPFEDRGQYLSLVLRRIAARKLGPGIIFLDPDTGLESGTPGLEHILNQEARTIWDALPQADVLVLYQHQTNRRGAPWVDAKRTQLERALGVEVGIVKVAQAPGIARDVVFYFVTKGGN